MSFTDQKPFTATEEHVRASWSGRRAGKDATTHPLFRCAWCGHRFVVNDVARWVLTNTSGPDTEGIRGNPFICSDCDGPRDEILARLRTTLAEFSVDRFWWFREHSSEANAAASRAYSDAQRDARDAYNQGRADGYYEATEDGR